MRLKCLLTHCPPLALACVLCCAAGVARAQSREAEQARAPRVVAEKVDEFGDLRHCDLSARLDNFAVELQNQTGAKGYVVAYAPDGGKDVDARLRRLRAYLISERAMNSEQFFFYNSGVRDGAEDFTAELWVVPEGAVPPVPLAALEEARKDFSGMLDAYRTSESVYHEEVEMGVSYETAAMGYFAEKLRRQPDCQGYVVVRAAKASPPGSSERLARRERRRLEKEHKVEAARLKTIDAGYTDDEDAFVELWVLPKDAQPPAGISEKLERVMTEAFQLNALQYYDEPDADEVEWVIENLAESLRRDTDARACIIVRERAPQEEETWANASQGEAVSASADAAPLTAASEGESKYAEARGVAEQWKLKLAEKYGVEAHRVQVMLGWPTSFGGARIELWVAPPKAMLPDPLVVTKDEESEEVYDVAGEGAADAGEAEPTPPL